MSISVLIHCDGRTYRIIDDVGGLLACIPKGAAREPYALRVGNKVLDSVNNIMRQQQDQSHD